MSEKEKRTSIINSISNWLKLLALLVIVAESIILVAMYLTPSNYPVFPWYPFVMIFLIVVVIVAVFVDRFSERMSKNLTIFVDDKMLTVNSNSTLATTLDQGEDIYSNSFLGYSFIRPHGEGWNEPVEISYTDYIKDTYLIDDVDDNYLETLISSNNPFGCLMFNAKILELVHGSNMIMEFDEETTSDPIEYVLAKRIELSLLEGVCLTDSEITKLRMELNQTDEISKVSFSVKLNIMALKKTNVDNSVMILSLPNLFLTLTSSSKEPIDSIVSNNDSILWTTSNKLKNVTIGGERYSSFYVYRLYQLVQNRNYMYLCTVQWSPQIESPVFVWDKLKKSFESFKIRREF